MKKGTPRHHASVMGWHGHHASHHSPLTHDSHFSSANGAASYQPGPTPQERHAPRKPGLKARAKARSDGAGLQPSWIGETVTQGVALGWNVAGALPLANKPTAALDAESAEVLGNIRGLL